MANDDVEKFLKKVEEQIKTKKLDLSSDEDLAVGVMNLISIEEHLFFTAQKTGKPQYYELLRQAREMRKSLLKRLIKEYEGEVWCISKHLLAASMRLLEVGTKALGEGHKKDADEMFNKSYDLWSMFWALKLDMIDAGSVDKHAIKDDKEPYLSKDLPPSEDGSSGFLAKMKIALKKAIDCCKE